jgi:hypothetical protein
MKPPSLASSSISNLDRYLRPAWANFADPPVNRESHMETFLLLEPLILFRHRMTFQTHRNDEKI